MDNLPNKSDGIIHLVDDERDIVSAFTQVLERYGYSVHAFSNTDEALKDITTCGKKVSLLITDIRMPGHSGFEMARIARAAVPHVPVIFMTAFEVNSSEFDKVFPTLEGQNKFFQKPVHINELIETVQELVRT
jgi:FixJ family two-component response regulator